ncbi:MAG: diguanylate cyclase [Pseudomonadota bacterium]
MPAAPPIPNNDAARVTALHELQLLDTRADERFDRVTRIASDLLEAPITLVSLVDDDRQWFKSRQGLTVTETPRPVAFAAHTICHKGPLVVPDVLADDRFADNPWVSGTPKVRFYAGVPLKTATGMPFGSLCVYDHAPRKLDQNAIERLLDLGGILDHVVRTDRAAIEDPITSLPNQRGFEHTGEGLLRRCARQRLPASMAVLQVKGARELKRDFGNAAFERTLLGFAEAMQEVFRERDLLAHLGGGRFVALVANCTDGEASRALTRLRMNLRAQQGRADGAPVAFDFGVTTVRAGQPLALDAMMRAAQPAKAA